MELMRVESFYDPVYCQTVYVCQGETKRTINKFAKDKGAKDFHFPVSKEVAGMVSDLYKGTEGSFILVFFSDKVDITNPEDVGGTVGHEAFHVLTTSYKYSGVEIEYDKDETHAYYLGFIATEILKCLVKLRPDRFLIDKPK